MKKEIENSDIAFEILPSLVSADSIKIFLACEKGIDSSEKAIKELGLTQKRYYTWLKRLVNSHMVEKRGNTYLQTTMGKFCHTLWKSFLNIVTQRDQLELADKLMKAETLSTKEKEKLLRVLSDKELSELMDVTQGVRMIQDYEDLIKEVVNLLDNAQESVYIVAHKSDFRVVDAMANLLERGVKFFFLGSGEKDISDTINAFRMILNPALVRTMRNLIKSREINARTIKVKYSYCVVDEEYGAIELLNPANEHFYVAFEFKNRLFCKRLIESFNSLYEKATPHRMLEFVRESLQYYK